MRCKKCGSIFNDDLIRCPHCGAVADGPRDQSKVKSIFPFLKSEKEKRREEELRAKIEIEKKKDELKQKREDKENGFLRSNIGLLDAIGDDIEEKLDKKSLTRFTKKQEKKIKKEREKRAEKANNRAGILVGVGLMMACGLGLLFFGGSSSSNDAEQLEQASTTAPTVEAPIEDATDESLVEETVIEPTCNDEAQALIDSRRDYLDELNFEDLSHDAKMLIEESGDELADENKTALKKLSKYAIALQHIYEADYSFKKGKNPTKADYRILKNSPYCSDRMYTALTRYKKYNNQRWKRKNIVRYDYDTDKYTYMVTTFSSFRLKDKNAGFIAKNIKPVTKIRVLYKDEYGSIRGKRIVSSKVMLGNNVKVKMDDGGTFLVKINKKKKITIKYDGLWRSLSNVVTNSETIVHKKDKRTKESKSIVYYTLSGEKYHRENCPTLSRSKKIYKTTIKQAKALGLGACGVCHP